MWITCGQNQTPDLSTFDAQATHGIWKRCHEAWVGAKLLSLKRKTGLSTETAATNNNINKIYK